MLLTNRLNPPGACAIKLYGSVITAVVSVSLPVDRMNKSFFNEANVLAY